MLLLFFAVHLSIDCVGILKLRNADVEQRIGLARSKKKSTRSRMVFRVNLSKPDGGLQSLQVASTPISCSEYLMALFWNAGSWKSLHLQHFLVHWRVKGKCGVVSNYRKNGKPYCGGPRNTPKKVEKHFAQLGKEWDWSLRRYGCWLIAQPAGLPEISKKSLDESSVKGGQELFLIGKNFLKGTKVYFQEKDEDTVVWSKEAPLDQEYFQQVSSCLHQQFFCSASQSQLPLNPPSMRGDLFNCRD